MEIQRYHGSQLVRSANTERLPIKYTRFQNENVHVYFTCRFSISGRKSIYTIFEKSIACPVVTVRARRCLHPRLIFYETPMPSVSFCLFAHPIRLPLSICISVPPHANKQKNRRFFLCVRMPRWNIARFSDDHRARPGNFYWRTG